MKIINKVTSVIDEHESQIRFFIKNSLRQIFWKKIMANSRINNKYEDTIEAQIDKLVDTIFDTTEVNDQGVGHFDDKDIDHVIERLKKIVDNAPDEDKDKDKEI